MYGTGPFGSSDRRGVFLAAVALIHLDGTNAQPTAEVLGSPANVQEFEIRVNPGESRISRSAVIATGVRTSIHGVDSLEVLDTDPWRFPVAFRMRTRCARTCKLEYAQALD